MKLNVNKTGLKSGKGFQLDQNQAMQIASYHLRNFKSHRIWKDACPTAIYKMVSPKNQSQVTHYEIKISTPFNEDSGYIIISTKDNAPPIRSFGMKGKTHTERLRAKSGFKKSTIVFYTPFYMSCIDVNGKLLASIGNPTKTRKPTSTEKPLSVSKPLDSAKIKPTKRDRSNDLKSLWKFYLKSIGDPIFPSISKESDDHSNIVPYTANLSETKIVTTYYENHDVLTEVERADFYQRGIPYLEQFEYDGKTSGCGATAWAALCCYISLHWDPSLLYGTHGFGLDDYVKRLIKRFHHAIRTKSDGNNYVWDMENGYNVISGDLLCLSTPDDLKWFSYDVGSDIYGGCTDILSFLMDMIFNYNLPAMVYYPLDWAGLGFSGHYAFAVGMICESGEIQTYQNHILTKVEPYSCTYVHIHNENGGDGDNLEYIDGLELYGVWTVAPNFTSKTKRTEPSLTSNYSMGITNLDSDVFCAFNNGNRISVLQVQGENYGVPSFGNPPVTPALNNIINPINLNPAGAISATSWACDTPLYYPNPYQPIPIENKKTMQESMAKSLKNKPFGKYRLQGPRLVFLAWRDDRNRIHISYNEISNLSNNNWTDYVLPFRFRSNIDPTICVANAVDQMPTDGYRGSDRPIKNEYGPLLYISFVQTELNFDIPTTSGVLLIMKLSNFFHMVDTGEDLWPTTPNTWELSRDENGLIYDVTKAEVVFWDFLQSVKLTRDGFYLNSPEILWTQGNCIYVVNSSNGIFDNFGANFRLDIDIKQAKQASGANISKWMGTESISWMDPEGQTKVAMGTKESHYKIIANVYEYASSSPAIYGITDIYGNQPALLGWFGNDSLHSFNLRLLQVGPWIRFTRDLPNNP